MLHLSKDSGVSDFYITPWEQLSYRRNGKLYFDSFVYQPERPLEFTPGCIDYAMTLGNRRYRVNRMVTRGRPRWVMRLLPEEIPDISKLMVPPAAIKAFLDAQVGTDGGPVDAAARAKWVRAFRDIATAAEAAIR
jgi:twitching motility protein PilT